MKLRKYLNKSIYKPLNRRQNYFLASIFLASISLQSCQQFPNERTENLAQSKSQIKAIHLFSRSEVDSFELEKIKSLHVNSLVLVPFLYQRGLNTDTVIAPGKKSYEWTEREDGIIGMARLCIKNDLNLILKPHIWPVELNDGEWRESINPDRKNWPGWSQAYENAILRYAEICEREKISMLCIGAELKELALQKPEYWRKLIKNVRKIYSGKLTYAANWYEEYEKITFWDELDYIGIQAYFPISSSDSSDIDFMKNKWTEHSEAIRKISEKYEKPILITEMGYRSSKNAGIEPWLWDEHWNGKGINTDVSEEMQALCYKVFFETLWQKNWCEGVLIWNWKVPYHNYGGPQTSTFTPQRKKSEEIIRNYFK